jgi:TP901 family phage tail tape measure protein
MDRMMSLSLVANTGNFVKNIGEGGKAFKTFAGTATGVGTALAATSETFKRFDAKVKQTGQAMLLTSAGMAASMLAATHEAGDFQERMLEVSSITKETGGELKNTGDQVMEMSGRFRQGSDEMAAGLYDLASSGLEGADAMEVLGVANTAATAGMTDTATASRAITAVLNAYQLSASEATDVSDTLFKTVEVGVLRFEDLALQLGDFVPLGQAAGVTMGEMGAAIAALTRGGFPAAQAATSLAGAMRAFIKPSEAMNTVVSDLGFESASAMLKTEGLEGALKMLHGTTGGNIESMGQLFQDTEGLRGVLTLTANDGALLSDALDKIADRGARAGATQDAFAIQSQGLNVQMDILKNNIENASIQVGEHYLPAVTKVVETGSSMISVFNSMPEPVHKATAYFGVLATGLMALGGFFLATQLRMQLYGKVFTAFSNQMGSGKLGKSFQTAADQGGGLFRVLGRMAEGADLSNTKFARFGGTVNRVGGLIGNMKMRTVGAVAAVAMIFLDLAASSKAARQEAEQWADAKMSATMDTSSVSSWAASIDQAKAEYNEFKEEVFDSYNTLDRLANVGSKIMPFMASSFEINANKADELWEAVRDAEKGYKRFNEAMSTTVYHTLELANADTGDILADMFDIESAERAIIMADRAIGMWGDVTSTFDSGQAVRLFEAVDPAQVAAIAEQARLIEKMSEGEGRDEAISQQREMELALASSTAEWVRNGGAAQDFEQQLITMRDPVMKMVDGAYELSDAQKTLHEAMGDVGSADFDQTLQTQTDLMDTFRDKAEDSGKKAKIWAQDLVEAGYISQEFYDRMVGNMGRGDDSWDSLVSETKLSLADYAATLEQSTRDVAAWQEDMMAVSGRAAEVFPEDVAALSEDVTTYLAGMGEDGVDLTAAMADGTDEEFQRMYLAIIGHLKSTSEEGAVEMDAAMKIIEEAGRLGGEATATAIADELGLGVGAVQGIMDEYGDVIVGGVNEILVQMGRAKIQRNVGKQQSAARNEGKRFAAADGGFLPAEATFEPANRGNRGLVQWAEAETEGEWFIPAAKSKKQKSTQHLADAAAHFGYALTPMADGGLLPGMQRGRTALSQARGTWGDKDPNNDVKKMSIWALTEALKRSILLSWSALQLEKVPQSGIIPLQKEIYTSTALHRKTRKELEAGRFNPGRILAEDGSYVDPSFYEDKRTAEQRYGHMVRLGEVKRGTWEALKTQGWAGIAGDNMEALWKYVRLGEISRKAWDDAKKKGWKGNPKDGMEALWPPAKKFADGGWFSGSDVPKPPAFGPGNINRGGRVGAEELHAQTAEWVDQNGMGVIGQGSVNGIDKAFLKRFNMYSDEVGGLSIVSGFRNRQQQAALYDAYKRGVPGQARAAKPGSSMHEKGLAIDHSPNSTASMRATASNFRLYYPMGDEPWHVQPLEVRSFDRGGYLEPGFTLAHNGTGAPEPVGSAAMAPEMTVLLDAAGIDRALVEFLRRFVRINGRGNVQMALGQKQ